MKTLHYIIGDIHGCFEELMELEQKIKKHAVRLNSKPHIVSVGDLVDRGPDSAKVVKHFKDGVALGSHSAVMGNHEAEFISNLFEWAPHLFTSLKTKPPKFIRLPTQQHKLEKGQFTRNLSLEEYRQFRKLMWVGQGGATTLQSFGGTPEDVSTWTISKEDLKFLLELLLIWENKDIIVTHALANSESIATVRQYTASVSKKSASKNLNEKHLDDVMWSRVLPKEKVDVTKLHVSGHTPLDKIKFHKKVGSLQIDTGCVYGRRLTAWCSETKDLLRVKAKKAYA